MEVEWTTLAFFMALFVLVGGMVRVGAIGLVGEMATWAMGGRELVGVTGLLFGSAVLGAVVDNIPYTTAMVPVVADLVASTPRSGAASPLWWAFVFGADLGGNTTAVAAGANVVVLGVAERAGHPVGFWQFARFGVTTVAVTVATAWLYVWLRYFAFV
jgi:Na+/H+ antiporter NhaD/arsenite permease-like protein